MTGTPAVAGWRSLARRSQDHRLGLSFGRRLPCLLPTWPAIHPEHPAEHDASDGQRHDQGSTSITIRPARFRPSSVFRVFLQHNIWGRRVSDNFIACGTMVALTGPLGLDWRTGRT
jgi:hypothetical protein